MSRWLIFLFCAFSAVGRTQIVFDELVYSFGIIAESEGEVFHNFHFTNNGAAPITIRGVETGCGCTAGVPKDTVIGPGESSFIQVAYNPAQRPGSFVKSVGVEFGTESGSVRRYLNIKGFVADRVAQSWSSSIQKVEYHVRLAPYMFNAVSLNDTSFGARDDFREFLNDLTYCIDKDNFVNLNITIRYLKSTGEAWARMYESRLKSNIRSGLIQRMYPEAPAGLGSVLIPVESLPDGHLAEVVIISPKYTDKGLASSQIIPLSTLTAEDTVKLFPFPYESYLARTQSIPLQKKWESLESWPESDKWLRTLRLQMLTDDTLIIGNILYAPGKQSEVKKLEKSAQSLTEHMLESLAQQGIPAAKVHIRKTLIYTDSVQGFDPSVYACLFIPKRELVTSEQEDTITWTEKEVAYKEEEKFPVQNLPVYFQQLHGKGARIDTASLEFQRIMHLVMARIAEGHPISILLESSASNLPTREKFDNHYVAELRARDSKERIVAWLTNHGYNPALLTFESPITLVQGPEYNLNYYLHSYYKQFQYIRLIPIYKTPFDLQKLQMSPYMINFGFGDMEFLDNTDLFNQFADNLAQSIRAQGFIRLIIESSSSKVPTYIHGNNAILAGKRAEDAKQKLMQAVLVRGADPMRMIVTEERAIVQGPDYEGDIKTNPYKYEAYQYIKLIPEHLIRQ